MNEKTILTVFILSLFLIIGCTHSKGRCGNGICEQAETQDNCPSDCHDCKTLCGDTTCAEGEPSSITTLKDIPYGKHRRQKLDVFYSDTFVNAPIMIAVHGGGWEGGDKRKFETIAHYFNNLGFVAVVPNYRLSSDGYTFPAPVNDVACAVAWIKKNADKYGADKSKIILFGNSAGSHIDAMLAYNNERDWLEECNIKDEELKFKGFIGLSGVYDFDLVPKARYDVMKPFLGELFDSSKWQVAEPINFVAEDDPPSLLIHGDQDDFINYQNSIDFAKELNTRGVYNILDIIPGYRHSGPMEHFFTNEKIQKEVSDFAKKVCECSNG